MTENRYLGNAEEALKWAQLASRRDPYVLDAIREGYFDIYFMAGRYEDVIEQTRDWRHPPPHIYAELAAAYAMLDRMDEAHAAAAHYKELDLEAWKKVELRHAHCRMCAVPEDAERWREGYRKAGIPV